MNKKLRVACLQMNSSDEVEQNLQFVEQQLQLAQQQGVELLLLPENFAQMPKTVATQHREPAGDGLIQEFLASQASQHSMYLIAGSVAIQVAKNNKPFARSLLYDPVGELIASYDKIHLYDVDLPNGQKYRESDTYTPGPVSQAGNDHFNLVVAQVSFARIGLSICYDLRFPEMYRRLTELGAQVITVPSAFTYQTGQAHWQALLRARAIENQAYVLAAAQVGVHSNGRHTWGHTMIVDPWGKVLKQLPKSTGLVICDIDLIKLSELRAGFPALKHRRMK